MDQDNGFLDGSSSDNGDGADAAMPPPPAAPSTPLPPPRQQQRGADSSSAGAGGSPAIPPTPAGDDNENDDDDDADSVVPPTPAAPPRGGDDDDDYDDDHDDMPGTPLTPLKQQHGDDDDDEDEQQEPSRQGGGDNDNDDEDQNADAGAGPGGTVGVPPNFVEDDGDDAGGAGAAGQHAGDHQEVHIRGTDVHVPTVQAAFTDFLRTFRSLKHARRLQRRQQRRTARADRIARRQERRDTRNNNSDGGGSDDSSSDSDSDSEVEDMGAEGGDELPPPPPLYLARLESLLARGAAEDAGEGGEAAAATTASAGGRVSLELDTMHLYYHSQACQRLYHQLLAFPMEIVTLMDLVAKHELERLAAERQAAAAADANGMDDDEPYVPQVQVRPYNLRKVSNLRCLDPVAVDTLVCLKGMVVRTSPIIPDLKVAHFSCTMCGHSIQEAIDRGKIPEPHRCPDCNTNGSYALVHNRCWFGDKQLVRLQERPDQVPAGQTPASVICFAFDGMVDSVQPGDRVEVTGVLRAQPARVNPKLTKVKAVYKTYLDVIHYKKMTGMDTNVHRDDEGGGAADESKNDEAENADENDKDQKQFGKWTAERVEQLKALSQDPDIYDKLTRSLAPSIWELDNIKRGILCMLFGGNHVRVRKSKKNRNQNRREDGDDTNNADSWMDEDDDEEEDDDGDGNNNSGSAMAPGTATLHKRGDINILLCGDPGTSKSQLLSYVNKLSARGVYTSGKGSSAVGLTAAVVRDPETRDLVLESGALVLSDLGICCIDEFDKMSDTTRSVLHEAMEQQTVSIAKAGIIATLHARTSVLASANPIESRYNPNISVVENIQLPPTLLSRFDLIYLILDSPNVEQDRRLAQHLVGLYYETPNVVEPPIDQALLRDYIEYAREHIHPEITDEASDQLIASYLELRGGGGNSSGGSGAAAAGIGAHGTRTISATPRQLESLIRLSEGLAKMRYSTVVTRGDALEAVRLLRVATQAAATDPRTGRIDMDMITTGRSSADRELEEQMTLTLKELFAERRGTRMAIRDVAKQLAEITNNPNIPHADVVEALRRMEADGLVQLNERAQTIFVRTGIVR